MTTPPSKTGYLIVSRRVALDRQPVRFLYREPPDHSDDSGWRVFAGDEDQNYADDPANLGLYAAATIIAIDPSIAPLLEIPAPCAFERDRDSDEFRKAKFGFAPDEK